MKNFFVRVYQPYIVDFVWELMVPGKSQKTAMAEVGAIMNDDTKVIPSEWITKSGYEFDGADMPCLHGHTGWEVLDKDSNDHTSIKPDTSGQRAFFFSRFVAATPSDGSAPWKAPVRVRPIKNVTGLFEPIGVLIAEPIGKWEAIDSAVTIYTLDYIQPGKKFWCEVSMQNWRILWVFTNP